MKRLFDRFIHHYNSIPNLKITAIENTRSYFQNTNTNQNQIIHEIKVISNSYREIKSYNDEMKIDFLYEFMMRNSPAFEIYMN